MTAAEVDQGGILLVCAGNVCRSPLAALTLRRCFARLAGYESIAVVSAGVRVEHALPVCADVGSLRDDDSWQRLAAAHRARQLEPGDVQRASLVLTASRGIRSSVVEAAPDRRHTVFTLREAVWLGRGYRNDTERGSGEAVVAFQRHLDGMRGLRPLPRRARWLPWQRAAADPFDIQDGHNLRGTLHRATLRAVFDGAEEIAGLITAPRPPH